MEWLFFAGAAWIVWKVLFGESKPSTKSWKPPEEVITPPLNLTRAQMVDRPIPPREVAKAVSKPVVKSAKVLPQIELSEEAKQALQALDNGKNVFISGAAGTGKSTFLKYLLARLEGEKNAIVVAPTGVAALNVNGQTIHSFFKLKTHILTEDDVQTVPNKKPYKKIDLIIIDEISMVRADIFDSINRFMKKNGRDPSKPFGGTQVLLLGDLYQLPPVLTSDDKEFFNTLYEGPFFFFSSAFRNGGFTSIEFKKVFRQKDIDFVTILNRVRVGQVDGALIETVNSRCARHFPNEDVQKRKPIILTARNATAEAINNQRLQEIAEEARVFEGIMTGNFGLKDAKLPAPMELKLKRGARVMFTKNDNKERRWVNGTIGTVVGLGKDRIMVEANGSSHVLEREKWENIRYVFNEEDDKWEKQVVGSYSQYPLMLAWAITIHKSQGQTLDSCMVDLEGGAFAEGQTYVALSRCRTFEGLFLKQDINLSDIRVNADVKHFMGGVN